jgi:anti-anti-sigma regulatory factor
MQITFSKHEQVTVMHLMGDIDASNYTSIIDKAQEAYNDGARHLVLDLEKVPYVSSAGLMALHTIARIFSGQMTQPKEGGRPVFRSLNQKQDTSAKEHVKLLNPQAAVEQVLEVVGLKQFLEIYTDFEKAKNSF